MSEWMVAWLGLGLFDKIVNVAIFVFILSFAGFGLVRLLRSLRFQKTSPIIEKTEKGWKLKLGATEDSKSEEPVEEIEEAELEPLYRIPFTQHTVFFTLKKMMERGVEFEKGSANPNKIRITEVFLEDCLSFVFYTRLKDWVQRLEEMSLGPSRDVDYCLEELYTVSDKIYKWIDEYNQKARELRIDLPDGRYISGVPENFIRKFDTWHEVHIETILSKIRQILYSEFYGTWQLKLILILDHLDTVFLLTEYDARKALAGLNGDLDKEIEQKVKQDSR
jgi:hypothetical protein